LYAKADRKGLAAELVPKIERILARLDIAANPAQMNLPGWHLHAFEGGVKRFLVSLGEWKLADYLSVQRNRCC
jgi:proteic killer suppression protein